MPATRKITAGKFFRAAASKTFSVLRRIFAVSATRIRGAFFRDHRAVVLRINARAAGVDKFFRRREGQPFEQVPCAFQINPAVILHTAAAATQFTTQSKPRGSWASVSGRVMSATSGLMPAASNSFSAAALRRKPKTSWPCRPVPLRAAGRRNRSQQSGTSFMIYDGFARRSVVQIVNLNHQS